ncbi:MAG: Gfo/Idh/MocA family oxidoreductase [Bacteroidota bacterium]
MKTDRRNFIKNTSAAAIGVPFIMSSGNLFANPANDTVNVAVIGTGGRSKAFLKSAANMPEMRIVYACDVDQVRLDSFIVTAKEWLGYKVKQEKDFRKILEKKSVDAVIIVTPEHWHAPMAIMAMQAGKHVYIEKPCSHNLHENDLLVQVYKKTGMVCQMGNQQRSSVSSRQAISDIQNGNIGNAYAAKAWYSNTRGSIGVGKKVAAPDTLDWDLWQGPAPREDYRDNVHPYNWHWFRAWGTGEIHNNGTHEIDICRWALGVNLPKRVASTGGRLHFKEDDWEYYDTQLASYEFDGGKTINWEGRSCNGHQLYSKGRGAMIYGTEGSIMLTRKGYWLYDLKGNEINFIKEESPMDAATATEDTIGFDILTVNHIKNFFAAIREGETLHAPIDDASISTHLCHLGNIAQDLEISLDIDPRSGQVLNNDKAMSYWKRDYESGWEPKL